MSYRNCRCLAPFHLRVEVCFRAAFPGFYGFFQFFTIFHGREMGWGSTWILSPCLPCQIRGWPEAKRVCPPGLNVRTFGSGDGGRGRGFVELALRMLIRQRGWRGFGDRSRRHPAFRLRGEASLRSTQLLTTTLNPFA